MIKLRLPFLIATFAPLIVSGVAMSVLAKEDTQRAVACGTLLGILLAAFAVLCAVIASAGSER